MTDLILFQGEGQTLADRMKAAVQAEGLEALVKDAKAHVRTALADSVTEMSEQTGTQFTAKLDGWSAQWTDPDPKPQVTDRDAFGHWMEADIIERVEVIDHSWAAKLMNQLENVEPRDETDVDRLLSCLDVHADYVLPEDPITPLIDSGRCKIVGDPDDGYALIDTDTGEHVPGVTVTRARPQLRLVPKGKAQRAKAKRDVADLLGIDPALTDGGA